MSAEQFEDQLNGEVIRSMSRDREQFMEGDLERGEYLDKLTEHGLNPMTAEYMENLLSPDFVLSKISGAEKEEMRWLIRQQTEKIKAMHPPKRSPVQGDRAAALLDDENAVLEPLDDREIHLIETGVWDIFFRIGRSEGGWQQKELSSQYNVSDVRTGEEESNSRLRGLFS